MVDILLCAFVGYALGCINPAFIISKIKNKNLKNEGTGNYGATNVTMIIGRGFGVLVMLFDIGKGTLAYFAAAWLFSSLTYAGLLAGLFAVVGHCFPFYIRFNGGKGLATYGGVVLAYDPILFLVALCLALVLMLLVNYSFIFPYFAAVLVCVIVAIRTSNPATVALFALMALVVMLKHFPNLKKALCSTDIGVRDYILGYILKRK